MLAVKGAGVASVATGLWVLASRSVFHLTEPALDYTGALIQSAAASLRVHSAVSNGGIQIFLILVALVVKIFGWLVSLLPDCKSKPAAWVESGAVQNQAEASLTLPRAPMDVGSFILIEREGEWDEVLLVKKISPLEWRAYTTTPSASRTMWSLVELVIGKFRVVSGWDLNRSRPLDVAENRINWVCHPTDVGVKWDLDQGQLDLLTAEADMISELVRITPAEVPRHKAGSPTEIKDLEVDRLGLQAPVQGNLVPVQAAGGGQAASSSGQPQAANPSTAEVKANMKAFMLRYS